MAKKAPRRTAERILESSLALFNRFGEPNVSTTAIAADLHISAGTHWWSLSTKRHAAAGTECAFIRKLW